MVSRWRLTIFDSDSGATATRLHHLVRRLFGFRWNNGTQSTNKRLALLGVVLDLLV